MGNINQTSTPAQSDSKRESACPVQVKTSPSECPLKQAPQNGSNVETGITTYKNPVVYNVYSQPINPTNKMPVTPDQHISSEQRSSLPTERQASTIPKGGTIDETWTYPSPQMFWNALARKNKLDGVAEQDVETVIAIHNNMNENTWRQVVAWEELHPTVGPGREPKLLRFMGRPTDFSPKARLKMLFGYPAPFDRHDWIVDRGGREVRYVIDYYHDESQAALDQRPQSLTDATSMKSIRLDVRPALDSAEAILDRIIRMPFRLYSGTPTAYRPLPFFPSNTMKDAEERKAALLNSQWASIQKDCDAQKNLLAACISQPGADCGALSVALQRCTASVVCPAAVKDFDACVKKSPKDLDKISNAYGDMTKCLELFQIESQQVLHSSKRNGN